jgi:hypothetical protein
VNWNRIVKLALALLLAQFTIGFLEGAFVPSGLDGMWHIISAAGSFVVCAAIFAYFAKNQPNKPFVHAWLAVLVCVVLAGVLARVLADWLEAAPLFVVAIEWVALVLALLVGTSIGSTRRHRGVSTADA